jgi:AcrR family transcriptional regulator
MAETQPLPAPREAARSARRQALLATAEQVFAERGFAGATMAEIASRAGYSAGNLYNVFESKEALFREVCLLTWIPLHERQMQVLRSSLPFAAALDQLLEHVLDTCIEHRAFFVIYVRTTSGQGWSIESFGEEALRMEEEREAVFKKRIERAIAEREIPRVDAQAAASLFSGSFHHLIVRWIQNDASPETLRNETRALHALIRRGLGMGDGS